MQKTLQQGHIIDTAGTAGAGASEAATAASQPYTTGGREVSVRKPRQSHAWNRPPPAGRESPPYGGLG